MEKNATAEAPFGNLSQMVVFIIAFLAMLFFLNYYVFTHFRGQLGPVPDIIFWPLLIFMSLSMFIAMGISRFSVGPFSRGFYNVTMVWLGFSIILVIVLAIHDIIAFFIVYDTRVPIRIIISIVAIMTIAGIINAHFIRTKRINLNAKGLQKDIRIAHISDLHMGIGASKKWLDKLVDKVNSLGPDMILITGDLIDGPFKSPESMFTPLKRLNAPAYFSTGNHEFMIGIKESMDIIRKLGITALRNEDLKLDNNIQLLAIDDTWEVKNVLSHTLERARPDPNMYTILMSHQPRDFETAAENGVDLMLSGHTHGGQFFPFTILTGMVYRQGKGLHRSNGSTLYTTTGTGTWGPPIRLGSNNEIVLIKLKTNGQANQIG